MLRIAHPFKAMAASVYWYLRQGRWRLKDIFNDVYAGQSQSETFRSIFREVFAEEYVDEVDACGFVTKTDLGNLVRHLALAPGERLVDLACGSGGSGLWVARATGAELTGIDISDVAVERAQRRIADFGLDGRARFQVGDFAATGLAAESCDAAMSLDALLLVPDKSGSARETARILRPGARFAFTTWEADARAMVDDYRPLMEHAGFEIESYEETVGWESRQRGVHQRVLAQRETLTEEMGREGISFWIGGAETELPRLEKMRRVMVVGRKK